MNVVPEGTSLVPRGLASADVSHLLGQPPAPGQYDPKCVFGKARPSGTWPARNPYPALEALGYIGQGPPGLCSPLPLAPVRGQPNVAASAACVFGAVNIEGLADIGMGLHLTAARRAGNLNRPNL